MKDHLNEVTRLALVHEHVNMSTFCYCKAGMRHMHLLFQSLHVLNLVLIRHTDSASDLMLIHSFISNPLEPSTIWAMQREDDTAPGIRDDVLDIHDFHKPVIYDAIMVQALQLTGHHIFAITIMRNPLHHSWQFRNICQAAEGKSEIMKTLLIILNVICMSLDIYFGPLSSLQLLLSNPGTLNGERKTKVSIKLLKTCVCEMEPNEKKDRNKNVKFSAESKDSFNRKIVYIEDIRWRRKVKITQPAVTRTTNALVRYR